MAISAGSPDSLFDRRGLAGLCGELLFGEAMEMIGDLSVSSMVFSAGDPDFLDMDGLSEVSVALDTFLPAFGEGSSGVAALTLALLGDGVAFAAGLSLGVSGLSGIVGVAAAGEPDVRFERLTGDGVAVAFSVVAAGEAATCGSWDLLLADFSA